MCQQFLHTFRGTLLNLYDIAARIYRVGVNEIDRRTLWNELHETGCRINDERGTDDDKDVSLRRFLGSWLKHRDAFSEEDDERTQQRAVAGLSAPEYNEDRTGHYWSIPSSARHADG